MVKMRKGNVIVLGLSAENIKRLQASDPIMFAGEQIGLDGLTIYIVYGETEVDIVAELTKEETRQ